MIYEKDVIVPITPLRYKCSDNSNQETQCLYGEKVKILKQGKNGVIVKQKMIITKDGCKTNTLAFLKILRI